MLSAFQLENNRLTRLEADEIKHLASSVWVDLVEPDDDERSRVQTELGQNLATRPELEDIEASARFFEDEDGLHIHSFFFFEDADDHAGNSTVAFTIREGRLFTLRERELPAFRLYRMRVRNQTLVDGNAYELLLDLFETKIEQLADEIENIYSDLEKLSRVIMEGHQGDEYDEALSTLAELEDIEASARFFEDEDGLHIHSFFFFEDAEDHAGNSTVAFTIREGRLFTLRERELPAFRLYRMRVRNQTLVDGNAYELLLDLFETKIEQLADEIENIYSDLEKLSRVIMEGHQGDEYDEALSTLAELEDIGWKVRLCLMDTQRALNFLVRKARLPAGQLEQAREILRDIESLLPHNESLFQKVNFLMQAAMGFINIEQNRIIKIFSVVSVVFLPPTLVASSYGMNFEFMPELHWSFGYPGAIVFMMLAGLAPYLYFKRKNWL